jgi:hypothetical protein
MLLSAAEKSFDLVHLADMRIPLWYSSWDEIFTSASSDFVSRLLLMDHKSLIFWMNNSIFLSDNKGMRSRRKEKQRMKGRIWFVCHWTSKVFWRNRSLGPFKPTKCFHLVSEIYGFCFCVVAMSCRVFIITYHFCRTFNKRDHQSVKVLSLSPNSKLQMKWGFFSTQSEIRN